MKKAFVLLLCYCSFIYADSSKPKLIENIIKTLFLTTKISLFVQDKTYVGNGSSKVFNRVDDCKSADLAIIKSLDSISKRCLQTTRYIIVTNYSAYKRDKEVLGAIFWQKGRLNLIFRDQRLKELGLSLPSSYNKYIE